MRIRDFFERYWLYLFAVLLVLVTFLVYAESLFSYLVPPDDFHHIANWRFGRQGVFSAFLTNTYGHIGQGGHYRPFELLSFMFDTRFWGESYFARHLTNVAIQAANSVLVFLLGYRLTHRRGASLLAGLLFAVHPAHSSAVAWISGRTDLIAGFFCLVSLLLFARFLQTRQVKLYVLSLVFFIFGLLSKEIAFVLPALLFAYEWLFARQPGGGHLADAPAAPSSGGERRAKMSLAALAGLAAVAGWILSPAFVRANFAADGQLSPVVQKLLSIVHLEGFAAAVLLGIGAIFYGRLKLWAGRIPGVSAAGFFAVLAFFLPLRIAILGSFGGYNYAHWNNVSAHLQFSAASFVRDVYGALGLLWPVDFGYAEKILHLQRFSPLAYYAIFLFAVPAGFALFYFTWRKSAPLFFSLLFIPLFLAPVHNIMIRNTYYDPRYLYLPSAGVSLALAIAFSALFRTSLFKRKWLSHAGFAVVPALVLLSAFSLRGFNKRFSETGEIMRNLVTTLSPHTAAISPNSHFYFLTFPYLPIDIDRHIWAEAVLADALNFAAGEVRWHTEDIDLLFFVDPGQAQSVAAVWRSATEVRVIGLPFQTTKVIPAAPSGRELALAAIYDPSWKDPHPHAVTLRTLPALFEKNGIVARKVPSQAGAGAPGAVDLRFTKIATSEAAPVFIVYRGGHFELSSPANR